MSLADSRFKLLMYDELTAKKEKAELKVKKLDFEINLLSKNGADSEYIEKLSNSKWNYLEKVRNTEIALQQLEHDMNGGASLNPFLEQDKVESE